jgi:hypothetical protein
MLVGDDVPLADGTGVVIPTELRPRRGRIVVIAAALAVLFAAGIVFAMTRNTGEPAKPSTEALAATDPKPNPELKVEPIKVEPIEVAQSGSGSDQIEISPDPVGSSHRPVPVHVATAKPHDQHRQPVVHRPEVKHEVKVDPPPSGLTREAVAAKQSAARREYEAYKTKFGGRLDREWNDLLQFISYHPAELDEVGKKIDSFRGDGATRVPASFETQRKHPCGIDRE